MNAISPPTPIIPETAPFTPQQRAWLNGFLAGLYGSANALQSIAASPAEAEEDFPWHDPALEIAERLELAREKPFPRRLMSAMAQLDCGQCGYLCQTYAEALADGRETSASLCVPGARESTRALKQLLAEAPPPAAPATAPAMPAEKPATSRVTVTAASRLTRASSAKDVRHIVIDLKDSGLTYTPGDSLSIAAPNDPALVEATLAALRASGNEPVIGPDGEAHTLRDAFSSQLDIARPLDRTLLLLAMSATHEPHAAALRKLADGEDSTEPADADLLDLITAFPSARPKFSDLVRSLPSLKPRLYSIASSLRATPGEVHLCVSTIRDNRRGRIRGGIASTFLADRAIGAGPMAASVQRSHFRLPADPAVPIILCGPGTGIAPFRAFLQEREALGHKGRSWLFFGDQHRETDFLFEPEIAAWRANGTLSRLDTAFSRDQKEKKYVQHRMAENAADLWRWLQDGGYFYVCGDAMRMARDVDATLRKIAMTEGKLDEAQSRDWMAALARQGRYQRDVY
jgi:sulfite reductase (NADPH) flavoprotein alpha-component